MKRTLEQKIAWYLSAVKGALVLNSGMMEEDAQAIIDKSGLKLQLETDPEMGFHYDPEDVAEEILADYSRGGNNDCEKDERIDGETLDATLKRICDKYNEALKKLADS